MLNHITLMGRLTRDPEVRRTGSGLAVTRFTLAVDQDYKPEGGERGCDFIDCVAWRQKGEFVGKYFQKGRMMALEGRLTIRSWTDKDGNKRRSAEVVAENVYFGDSKKDSNPAPGSSYGDYQAPGGEYGGYQPGGNNYGGYQVPGPGEEFAALEDDDAQLPF